MPSASDATPLPTDGWYYASPAAAGPSGERGFTLSEQDYEVVFPQPQDPDFSLIEIHNEGDVVAVLTDGRYAMSVDDEGELAFHSSPEDAALELFIESSGDVLMRAHDGEVTLSGYEPKFESDEELDAITRVPDAKLNNPAALHQRTAANTMRQFGLALDRELAVVPATPRPQLAGEQRMQELYRAQAQAKNLATSSGDVVAVASVSKATIAGGTVTRVNRYSGPVFEDAGSNNQDSALALDLGGTQVYAVFDGVGGAADGRPASTAAREIVIREAQAYAGNVASEAFLEHIRTTVSDELNTHLGGQTNTTMTVVTVGEVKSNGERTCFALSCGDSLAFAVSSGSINQLTTDYSPGELTVDAKGSVEREPGQGRVICSSARSPEPYPAALFLDREQIRSTELPKGSTLLLTSDGITGDRDDQYPGKSGLGAYLKNLAIPSTRSADDLARWAIGNAAKPDDRTIIVVQVGGLERMKGVEPPRIDQLPNTMQPETHVWQTQQQEAQREFATKGSLTD